MKLAGLVALLAAANAAGSMAPFASDEGWEVLFEDSGVQVLQKPMPGRDLPVYRAHGVLEENLYSLMAVLNDFERHREWMRFMAETRVLWRPDDFNLRIYIRFDAPWPVWDRDTLMGVKVTFDRPKQVVTMTLRGDGSYEVPPKEGVIRVPKSYMYARLTYLGPKHTEVDCRMNIDPAGDLPRWLVRWFSKRVPLDALERLQVQIDKTRHDYDDFRRRYDPQFR